jgi:acetyl-CoA acetyltransferase
LQAVYILSAVRTPIGKFGGTMASLTAADMGVVAAKAAIERAGVRPRSRFLDVRGRLAEVRMWRGRFRCARACPRKLRRSR